MAAVKETDYSRFAFSGKIPAPMYNSKDLAMIEFYKLMAYQYDLCRIGSEFRTLIFDDFVEICAGLTGEISYDYYDIFVHEFDSAVNRLCAYISEVVVYKIADVVQSILSGEMLNKYFLDAVERVYKRINELEKDCE